MANKYFQSFPKIRYNTFVARNLVLKSQFFKEILDKINLFYPYVVKHDERADMIAHTYYGSSDFTWLVYFSNDILDPYFEWPLTDGEFRNFLVKKYGDLQTPLDTIAYYEYNTSTEDADPERDYRINYQMTPETYSFLSVDDKAFWSPVSSFDKEFALNEKKRHIQLFDNDLTFRVEQELIKIFK